MRTRTAGYPYDGQKSYNCDTCGAQFADSCNLMTHERTDTGNIPYKCQICGKQFAHNKDITRTYTGEKPYNCVSCRKLFAVNGSLK